VNSRNNNNIIKEINL